MRMFLKNLLLSPLLLTCTAVWGQDNALFVIKEGDKAGYINRAGTTVIKPVFAAANPFSEGLASARLEGHYGFIDHTGHFVIPATYDYAGDFSEGIALVYTNGQPQYIDRKGQLLFNVSYTAATPLRHGKAKIRSAGGKVGIIDTKGHLLVDTVYSSISEFSGGAAIVSIWDTAYSHTQYGLVDSLGKTIVPLGKYHLIQQSGHGIFKVEQENDPTETFVDAKGMLLFSQTYPQRVYISSSFNNGLAAIHQVRPGKYETDIDGSYYGYVDLRGKIVIDNPEIRFDAPFYHNRAFVRNHDLKWFLINSKGETIAGETFYNPEETGFMYGYALVRHDGEWAIADTNLHLVKPAAFEDVDEVRAMGQYVFFTKEIAGKAVTGIASSKGEILLTPVMEDYAGTGFKNGLLLCKIKGRMAYVSDQGKIVWEQLNTEKNKDELNLDYMNRGYFYTYHSKNRDPKAKEEEKHYARIPGALKTKPGALNVIAAKDPSGKSFDVTVANTFDHNIGFYTQDNRLYMKVQALDPKGVWRDIEYLPSSWCGNSYYTVELPGGHCWKFSSPVYKGAFKTKLRISLQYIDPEKAVKDMEEEAAVITVYSNEYEGSVNPAQFWRQTEYMRNGIMDPYNE